MKRILVVENGAGFGGALTSLGTLLSALDPSQYEVHLLTSYEQGLIQEGGAVKRVSVIPRRRRYGSDSVLERGLRPFFGRRAGNAAFVIDHLTTGRDYARAVARYVREYAIDLVQGNNGILINDAAILAARRAGVPCLIHSRDCEYPGRVTGWLAKGVGKVMAVSGHVADSLRVLGLNDTSIGLIPEGLDAEAFAGQADPRAFRARHGLPEGMPLVGMVACLVGWKGQDVFLDACAEALPRTGAGAVVVGGEPDRSGVRLAALKARVRTLGLEGRVWCIGHETDVASAMAACEVVVHASTYPEPFGRVLLETMAVGRPVIATDAGGPREVVSSGVDGLLVPPKDAGAMGRAMAELLGDEAMRERLGRAGWAKVREKYGIAAHAARMVAAWEDLGV